MGRWWGLGFGFNPPLLVEVIAGHLVKRLLDLGQGRRVRLESEEALVVVRAEVVIPGQQVNHQDQLRSEPLRVVLGLSDRLKQSEIVRIVGKFMPWLL